MGHDLIGHCFLSDSLLSLNAYKAALLIVFSFGEHLFFLYYLHLLFTLSYPFFTFPGFIIVGQVVQNIFLMFLKVHEGCSVSMEIIT